MLKVTPTITIPDDEIEESFIRASGPGGQHVNKSATAVQLRFDAARSTALPPDVRRRLMRQAKHLLTDSGVLIIEVQAHRSQLQNRQAAQDRLVRLVKKATQKPKPRKKTKPTKSSKERRLKQKKQRSQTKKMRQSPDY